MITVFGPGLAGLAGATSITTGAASIATGVTTAVLVINRPITTRVVINP